VIETLVLLAALLLFLVPAIAAVVLRMAAWVFAGYVFGRLVRALMVRREERAGHDG
jgi:hypothetical protein